jgi:predicted metalloprotease with PDZ domain
MSGPIRYTVRMPQPHAHRFEVEAWFPAAGDRLTVALPVWTPGSYLVREFSRHLSCVTAEDEQGAPLPLSRVDKRSFEVQAQGRAVRLRYEVYANELSVRTSHLDGSHAFWNGATLFLYDQARRGEEHRVRVEAPEGWQVFCALDPDDGGDFVARDYDALVDSPFEVGPHRALPFEVQGVLHQVVFWGGTPADPDRLVADMARSCALQAAFFGALPLRRYLFIVHLVDKGRSGLEHHDCSVLLFSRHGFGSVRGREDFLHLVAHEYFHRWNIKRVRPRALCAVDFGQENYTRLLWAFEGFTSYYDMLLTRRAGLSSPSRYLQRLGETLTLLHGTPGRRVMTLEDASLQAWIKQYRPDENSANSAISYYLKGEIVGWLLDLTLRHATGDQRSLDDVLRLLVQRYGDGAGVPEEGVEAAAEEVAGVSLQAFFDRSVRSTQELDYSVLSHVGLDVRFRLRESPGDRGGTPPRAKDLRPRGWLGATARPSGTIGVVYAGSAAMEAGLYADDEVVALDGFKVDGSALLARVDERAPGEQVRLTVFRRDRLVELPVILGEKPQDAVWLQRAEQPSEQQRGSWALWVGAPWHTES